MRRVLVLIASAAINASTVPVLASECTSSNDINASRTKWSIVRSQPADAINAEKACHAYAASFYESVTLRQANTKCLNAERTLTALDTEINAFNDLLASKCGG